MNRYYGICAALLFSLCSLRAMEIDEKPLITGSIYIDGPAICYGPGMYHADCLRNNTFLDHNFSSICIEEFEPLIKVKVIIDDKDEDNNPVQSLWSDNIPHMIRKHETLWWKKCQSRIDRVIMMEIEKNSFPSYIPVRLLKDITQNNNNTLKLLVHLYPVALKCIPNPEYNFIDQINDFIKIPTYFTYKIDDIDFNPVDRLLKEQFIKEIIKEEVSKNKLPEKEDDWRDQLGTHFKAFATDITKMIGQKEEAVQLEQKPSQVSYEHGEKGKKVVEQLKATFAHLLPLTGKVLLWPQQEEYNEKDKELPSGFGYQNFGNPSDPLALENL